MVKKVRKKIKKVEKEKEKKGEKERKIIIEKIPSGTPNFDKLTEGGFNKKSVNLVVGGAGSGKTIFAMQFLIGGLARGENGLYITFEEKREEFFETMFGFGWDLEKLEKEGRFIFLEYTPEKVRTMLEEGGGMIENIIHKNKIRRLVIDSITSFELLFESELEQREAALTLFDMIRSWNCSSLLTLERELTMEELQAEVSTPLEFEADSITLLYFIRQDGLRQRLIEILKMRATKHSKKVHNFEITSSGITVETKGKKH